MFIILQVLIALVNCLCHRVPSYNDNKRIDVFFLIWALVFHTIRWFTWLNYLERTYLNTKVYIIVLLDNSDSPMPVSWNGDQRNLKVNSLFSFGLEWMVEYKAFHIIMYYSLYKFVLFYIIRITLENSKSILWCVHYLLVSLKLCALLVMCWMKPRALFCLINIQM